MLAAAANIYAAYIATSRVSDGQENEWMDRAISAAFRMTRVIDSSVQADKEID